MPPCRILLIQLKRIGDFILTAPAVEAVRAAYPQAEIVMLVQKNVSALATCLGSVNRVITYETGRSNLEAWSSALVGEWDLCLDFTGTDRSALIVTLSRAKERIGYTKFSGRGLRKMAYTKLCGASVRELHTVDFHLALLAEARGRASKQVSLKRQAFIVPDEVEVRVKALLKQQGITGRFAIVHPGTAREEKFWLDERWAEIVESLHQEFQLPVLVTGAGDGLEKPHLAALKKLLKVPVVDFTGKLSLVELLALISQCEIIIGVDSMAMHLAAMFGKPQIALFGPTNPFHWRARHERAVVLTPLQKEAQTVFTPKTKKREMKQISTDAVRSAMRSLLSSQ